MDAKIEGTLFLDGLLEGRLPATPDATTKLREWVRFADGLGLGFSLELDGDAFSLLAEDRAIQTASWNTNSADRIAECLQELSKLIPPGGELQVFSTLRSREYLPGQEVQTFYPFLPDGRVEPRSRTVDTHTHAPDPVLSPQNRRRLFVGAAALALVLLGILLAFPGVRRALHEGWRDMTPLKIDEVKVSPGPYAAYFTVAEKTRGPRRTVILELERTALFPLRAGDFEARLSGADLTARLTLEALARGYVHCEYYDAEGRFMLRSEVRVKALFDAETLKLALPLDMRPTPALIVFTY